AIERARESSRHPERRQSGDRSVQQHLPRVRRERAHSHPARARRPGGEKGLAADQHHVALARRRGNRAGKVRLALGSGRAEAGKREAGSGKREGEKGNREGWSESQSENENQSENESDSERQG